MCAEFEDLTEGLVTCECARIIMYLKNPMFCNTLILQGCCNLSFVILCYHYRVHGVLKKSLIVLAGKNNAKGKEYFKDYMDSFGVIP